MCIQECRPLAHARSYDVYPIHVRSLPLAATRGGSVADATELAGPFPCGSTSLYSRFLHRKIDAAIEDIIGPILVLRGVERSAAVRKGLANGFLLQQRAIEGVGERFRGTVVDRPIRADIVRHPAAQERLREADVAF